jgi:Tfp pilus assembly protein PilN
MSQQINLYNPQFLKQEKHFSARTIVQALGLIVLGLGAVYGYALVQTRAAESLANDTGNQLNAQREQFTTLTAKFSPESRNKVLEAEVARLDAELKARQALLAVLGTGELGNTTGFSEFLAALGRQAMPGVWLTGLSIGESGNDLQVQGRALRPDLVPAYLKALNNEPMMRGRSVTEMKLAAKSAPPSAGAGDPGKSLGPPRFVEFSLSAPLRIPEAAAGAKGATP